MFNIKMLILIFLISSAQAYFPSIYQFRENLQSVDKDGIGDYWTHFNSSEEILKWSLRCDDTRIIFSGQNWEEFIAINNNSYPGTIPIIGCGYNFCGNATLVENYEDSETELFLSGSIDILVKYVNQSLNFYSFLNKSTDQYLGTVQLEDITYHDNFNRSRLPLIPFVHHVPHVYHQNNWIVNTTATDNEKINFLIGLVATIIIYRKQFQGNLTSMWLCHQINNKELLLWIMIGMLSVFVIFMIFMLILMARTHEVSEIEKKLEQLKQNNNELKQLIVEIEARPPEIGGSIFRKAFERFYTRNY